MQSVQEPSRTSCREFRPALHGRDVGFDFEHGTVVLWMNPDRLSYRRPGRLRSIFVDDFGVTYRTCSGRGSDVCGVRVDRVDPLFPGPGGSLYVKPENGGAGCASDRSSP